MRYLLLVLLVSCGAPSVKTVYDTVEIVEKQKFYDSVAVLIPVAEKRIKQQQKSIIRKIDNLEVAADSLQKENESLKEVVRVTKSIVIRDTIYIKEKTNFWGKKKISTDSTQSIDSTEYEND